MHSGRLLIFHILLRHKCIFIRRRIPPLKTPSIKSKDVFHHLPHLPLIGTDSFTCVGTTLFIRVRYEFGEHEKWTETAKKVFPSFFHCYIYRVSDGRASGLERHKTREHYHTDASVGSILFTLQLTVRVQFWKAYKLKKLKHYKQRAPNCKQKLDKRRKNII